MLTDIHKIAADFLTKLERSNYKEQQIETEVLASVTGLVALKRPNNPPFFYGFKPSGRPIFTHDLRLAKSFESSRGEVSQHIEHLATVGENVVPHPTIWSEGKHYHEPQL